MTADETVEKGCIPVDAARLQKNYAKGIIKKCKRKKGSAAKPQALGHADLERWHWGDDRILSFLDFFAPKGKIGSNESIDSCPPCPE
jgi:hypothetical protein